MKERGLNVNNGSRAIRILEDENYYNVINGYKNPFLLKNQDGSIRVPERYKPGATFEDIYKLFTFDRELRTILLKFLHIFENNIKSKISYRFSQKYSESHAYLQFQNYSTDPEQLERILRLIATLSHELSRKSKGNNPIKHYLDNHNGVPLWVLVNYLTLGNMSNFYMSLDDCLQDTIAKSYSMLFKKSYGQNVQIPKNSIEDVLKMANLFRNVCAHEERLYNYKLDKPPRKSHNSKLLAIPMNLLHNGDLFTMVSFLKLVLLKEDHRKLIKELSNLFGQYTSSFSSLGFHQILSSMGFPQNWKNYF